MYILIEAVLIIAIALIVGSITWLTINKWQQKHDVENACFRKDEIKAILTFLLIGIGSLIISKLLLLLHIC